MGAGCPHGRKARESADELREPRRRGAAHLRRRL